MTQVAKPFNPHEHVTKLPRSVKNKETDRYEIVYDDYLEVKWRLVWFRETFPNGTIDTEEIFVDLDREVEVEATRWVPDPARPGKNKKETFLKKAKGYARYKATVTDGNGGRATGTKSESAVDFADFCEKAETGSIGRALAALGFGTQFAPDMEEAHRMVDSPVETHQDEPQQRSKPSPSNHSTSPSNVVSLPPQGQAEAIENGQDKKNPVDTLYIRAKEVGAIDKALRGEAGGIAFLQWASGILGATISHVNQLTPSRLKTLEEALEKKDAA